MSFTVVQNTTACSSKRRPSYQRQSFVLKRFESRYLNAKNRISFEAELHVDHSKAISKTMILSSNDVRQESEWQKTSEKHDSWLRPWLVIRIFIFLGSSRVHCWGLTYRSKKDIPWYMRVIWCRFSSLVCISQLVIRKVISSHHQRNHIRWNWWATYTKVNEASTKSQ